MRTMIDHPGWTPTDDGWRRLLSNDEGGHQLVTLGHGEPEITTLVDTGMPPTSRYRSLTLDGWTGEPLPGLKAALSELGCVGRFGNPSLWEALATALIRQVVRADQATNLYRRFCNLHGTRFEVDGDTVSSFPAAETVLRLSDDQFGQAGLAFNRTALRAAARAFLDDGEAWRAMSELPLIKSLLEIFRVGKWSAGAAVADWSHAFDIYPYGDLAVRTWAARIAPDHPWPDTESAFAREWRRLCGDQLRDITMLTLAWGKNYEWRYP